MGLKNILEINVEIKEENLLSGATDIVKIIKPQWKTDLLAFKVCVSKIIFF